MKSDRNLRSSFKQLDAPGTPDLEYAATLRSQFVREARVDATSSIAAVASPQRKPAPLPKRRRWFDLAAAAVLLLSIIGGIARVSTTGDPTPTIQAPLTEQPAVMGGGTPPRTTNILDLSRSLAGMRQIRRSGHAPMDITGRRKFSATPSFCRHRPNLSHLRLRSRRSI